MVSSSGTGGTVRVRPAPLGSLVQRELAAARLTEGLTRQSSHRSRYLTSGKNQRFLPPPARGFPPEKPPIFRRGSGCKNNYEQSINNIRKPLDFPGGGV